MLDWLIDLVHGLFGLQRKPAAKPEDVGLREVHDANEAAKKVEQENARPVIKRDPNDLDA